MNKKKIVWLGIGIGVWAIVFLVIREILWRGARSGPAFHPADGYNFVWGERHTMNFVYLAVKSSLAFMVALPLILACWIKGIRQQEEQRRLWLENRIEGTRELASLCAEGVLRLSAGEKIAAQHVRTIAIFLGDKGEQMLRLHGLEPKTETRMERTDSSAPTTTAPAPTPAPQQLTVEERIQSLEKLKNAGMSDERYQEALIAISKEMVGS